MISKSGGIVDGKFVPMVEFIVHFMDGEKKTMGIDNYHAKELMDRMLDSSSVIDIGGLFIVKNNVKYFEF
ncbi:MAG: hypothetical protein K0R00_2480 [Herbinix sp.]|jgi:hypothetical protein|nr:hypothetical protein [Herbinix sp.]